MSTPVESYRTNGPRTGLSSITTGPGSGASEVLDDVEEDVVELVVDELVVDDEVVEDEVVVSAAVVVV
jgi:hypothetical protein